MDLPSPHADKWDYAAATVASTVVAISWVEVVDLTERVIGGALVIVLLVLRIRALLRRDRVP